MALEMNLLNVSINANVFIFLIKTSLILNSLLFLVTIFMYFDRVCTILAGIKLFRSSSDYFT